MNGINSQISNAVLTRFESSEQGTFGRFTCGTFSCFSGELPELDNQSNLSCIPKGQYTCRWTYSEHFKKNKYLVEGVPNRTGIRIHAANFMGDSRKGFKKQLNGCISLGMKIGTMDNQKALLLSSVAIRQFEDLMNKKDFVLEIK